ncbi:GTP-binding protein YchF [Neoconidiobolus thromboides FSU 785]|nr:GTP-binding protein YchF [Neoconidiobolus thromboides FSU 785]
MLLNRFKTYTIINTKQSFLIRHLSNTSINFSKKQRKGEIINEEVKLRLGRPSNNLKIGVVGLPNVGKSTFFNAITESSVPAENFPFCTIDPAESRVAVPDERFDWLCQHYNPKSKIPAYLTVIDIAGLVKGAANGAGLGNAFLNHIRSVDAIFHVCRSFEDENIIHVEDKINPTRDLDIIHNELRIKDMEYLTRHIETIKKIKKKEKIGEDELEITEKLLDWVENKEMDIRKGDWSNKEIEFINSLHLISAKPVIYLANLSVDEYMLGDNPWVSKLKTWIEKNNPGDKLITFSAQLEHELSLLNPEEKQNKLKEMEVQSALSDIIKCGYSALDLDHYFTAGSDEVRAWTILKGSKAPQAAGVIHSDFEKGFIAAEVIKFNELKELGSESAVKAAGKQYQKGKDYVVEDGDMMFFKFKVNKDSNKKK